MTVVIFFAIIAIADSMNKWAFSVPLGPRTCAAQKKPRLSQTHTPSLHPFGHIVCSTLNCMSGRLLISILDMFLQVGLYAVLFQHIALSSRGTSPS